METRQFGKTDMRVSAVGFGGAEIGFEHASAQDVSSLLETALDSGLNVIDTAECYLASEELIGQTVSERRDRYSLFTKCGHPEQPCVGDWRKKSLLDSIVRSLLRLKTDRVDLIHLHTCSEEDLRRGEVIEALQEAREKGYTRYIGYSGDHAAARYAVECGAFDSLQTSVNIADQEAIELTLPLARERGMAVIAKRPIANAAWRYPGKPTNAYHQTYWERLQKLNYDFLQGDPKQAASVALRFTLSVPGIHTAIVGTKNPTRWRENAELLKAGPLPAEQFQAIRARWREVADESWIGQT
ncbi:MAG TPA: aldo/keto reductase [Planctomycetaceae bacterium]|jgi:aryl-alcohol dehydrogenase-like predicted oxidoreductase|nr:aldo/keto reductase [Planctomycetaceae bacterium]